MSEYKPSLLSQDKNRKHRKVSDKENYVRKTPPLFQYSGTILWYDLSIQRGAIRNSSGSVFDFRIEQVIPEWLDYVGGEKNLVGKDVNFNVAKDNFTLGHIEGFVRKGEDGRKLLKASVFCVNENGFLPCIDLTQASVNATMCSLPFCYLSDTKLLCIERALTEKEKGLIFSAIHNMSVFPKGFIVHIAGFQYDLEIVQ